MRSDTGDTVKIWLVELEAHEQRYTKQWRDHLPTQIAEAAKAKGIDQLEIIPVTGDAAEQTTTDGAFLNFAGTNIFKSSQLIKIADAFANGEVEVGDKFLITDAWNPAIIQLRYMSELLKIPVEIHAIWHAGSYDEWDFLGREIADKRWSYAFERALFFAIDVNYFATLFHVEMFKSVLGVDDDSRIVLTGLPFEFLEDAIIATPPVPKRDLILFPHRLAPEKQPDVFRDLAKEFPGYEFKICQEERLTKNEYHRLLLEARMVFSANLQETLGISLYEGAIAGAMPLAPRRLSYVEMYDDEWLYPGEWSESWVAYQRHKDKLVDRMKAMLARSETQEMKAKLGKLMGSLAKGFFGADVLYGKLLIQSLNAEHEPGFGLRCRQKSQKLLT